MGASYLLQVGQGISHDVGLMQEGVTQVETHDQPFPPPQRCPSASGASLELVHARYKDVEWHTHDTTAPVRQKRRAQSKGDLRRGCVNHGRHIVVEQRIHTYILKHVYVAETRPTL